MSMFRMLMMQTHKGGGLPSGYQECEYLESTGTQYISTGYYPTAITEIEVTFMLANRLPYIWNTIFGMREGSVTRYVMRFYNTAGNKDYFVQISPGRNVQYLGYSLLSSVEAEGNKYTIKLGNGSITMNGVNKGTYAIQNKDRFIYPVMLFANNDRGNVIDISRNIRIYSFVVSENGEEKQHFVPCLDNNNTPCMYDIINRVAYYNQGSGQFTYALKES